MTSAFETLVSRRGWLLADGATGTTLFDMGLMSGDAPELWNDIHPDRIAKLYSGAVEAGSDLFLTNSFGANASRLKLHDAGHRARELSRISAEIGREVADRENRPVMVAGSVGPTGEIMGEIGTLSHEGAVDMFHEQAEGLKEGGADVLWLETISSQEEFLAAAEAFAKVDMPWCGTMSFDTAGRTMMGITSAGLVDIATQTSKAPVAIGANCGTGASDLLRTVQGIQAKSPPMAIIAKGNAGIPKYVDGHIHYDGTPELMAEYAVMARDSGAKIIGGCCGTRPDHLRKMREALETRAPTLLPSAEQIQETLGPFSSATDGTEPNDTPKRPARRRRRA